MISCVSEIIGSRKEDGLERLQEGGRETIWGLLGLHSFTHSKPVHGGKPQMLQCSQLQESKCELSRTPLLQWGQKLEVVGCRL